MTSRRALLSQGGKAQIWPMDIRIPRTILGKRQSVQGAFQPKWCRDLSIHPVRRAPSFPWQEGTVFGEMARAPGVREWQRHGPGPLPPFPALSHILVMRFFPFFRAFPQFRRVNVDCTIPSMWVREGLTYAPTRVVTPYSHLGSGHLHRNQPGFRGSLLPPKRSTSLSRFPVDFPVAFLSNLRLTA